MSVLQMKEMMLRNSNGSWSNSIIKKEINRFMPHFSVDSSPKKKKKKISEHKNQNQNLCVGR